MIQLDQALELLGELGRTPDIISSSGRPSRRAAHTTRIYSG